MYLKVLIRSLFVLQETSVAPAVCYNKCNDAYLEAQDGQTPALCNPNSAFRVKHYACLSCILSHNSDTTLHDAQFEQLKDRCTNLAHKNLDNAAQQSVGSLQQSMASIIPRQTLPPFPTISFPTFPTPTTSSQSTTSQTPAPTPKSNPGLVAGIVIALVVGLLIFAIAVWLLLRRRRRRRAEGEAKPVSVDMVLNDGNLDASQLHSGGAGQNNEAPYSPADIGGAQQNKRETLYVPYSPVDVGGRRDSRMSNMSQLHSKAAQKNKRESLYGPADTGERKDGKTFDKAESSPDGVLLEERYELEGSAAEPTLELPAREPVGPETQLRWNQQREVDELFY